MYVMYENKVKQLDILKNQWLNSSLEVLSESELSEKLLCLYKYYDNVYDEYTINRAKVLAIEEDSQSVFVRLRSHVFIKLKANT